MTHTSNNHNNNDYEHNYEKYRSITAIIMSSIISSSNLFILITIKEYFPSGMSSS